jgi:hypothetical protein
LYQQNKQKLEIMEIKDLKSETFFTVDAENIKNTYKLIGECEPKIYAAAKNLCSRI